MEAKGKAKEAVKEAAKGRIDPALLLLVLVLEKVFLLVLAAIRALMVPDAANYDTTSGNGVRNLPILTLSHVVNTILEQRSRK